MAAVHASKQDATGSIAPAASANDADQNVLANSIELSVVVPTFNESANVAKLVELLDRTLQDVAWEVIFVDDNSPDKTWEAVNALSQTDRRVRGIRRIGRRGLSTACIEGALSSSAPFVAVMDGDLQHDEAALQPMLDALRGGETDIAVGTRYAEGGSTGDWDRSRERMSQIATTICKMMTGAPLSDPMSGFFMMRRDAFLSVVDDLSGMGFKILLDIVATGQKRFRITEVPFTFRTRQEGESKLSMLVLWEFLMLLLDKKIGRFVPVRFLSFAMIGGAGVVVHFIALTLLFQSFGVSFVVSQTAAAVVAMISNFALNNILTYRDRRKTGWGWFTGLASFMLVCSLGMYANVGVANYMYNSDTNWAIAAIIGILIGAVWNYALSSVYTWKK